MASEKNNRTFKTVGRITAVSPKDSERFQLKLILNHIRGATSYHELRTFDDITYNTFKETANAMNLVNDDAHVINIFKEAVEVMMPKELRHFFALFIMSEYYQAATIWQNFQNFFVEGFDRDPKLKLCITLVKF